MGVFQSLQKLTICVGIMCRTLIAASSEIEKSTQTFKTFSSIKFIGQIPRYFGSNVLKVILLQNLLKPYWFCWQTGQQCGIRKGTKRQNLLHFKKQMTFTDKLFL